MIVLFVGFFVLFCLTIQVPEKKSVLLNEGKKILSLALCVLENRAGTVIIISKFVIFKNLDLIGMQIMKKELKALILRSFKLSLHTMKSGDQWALIPL